MQQRRYVRTFAVSLTAVILSATLQSCNLIETILVDPLAAALDRACTEAPFEVTKLEDTNDGICTTDDCSLREAIITSNYCSGAQEIHLPAGRYEIKPILDGTRASPGGSLTVKASVDILGIPDSESREPQIQGPELEGPVFVIRGELIDLRIERINIGNCRTAVFNENNQLHLRDVFIHDCDQEAIYSEGPNAGTYLQGTSIQRNATGIVLAGGRSRLVGSNVNGNSGPGIRGMPADSSDSVELTLSGSSVSVNDGFGIAIRGGLTVNQSIVTRNENTGCALPGAGIWVAGDLNIWNSTVSRNGISCAGEQAAVWSEASGDSLSGIDHATIYRNRGDGLGGSQQVVARASIIAQSTGDDCAATFTVDSRGYNLDSDGTCGLSGTGDLSGVDPLFDSFDMPTAGSPVIDAIVDSCPPPSVDQNTAARPVGGGCEIGAIELTFAITSAPPEEDLVEIPEGEPTGPTTCRFGPRPIYPAISYLSEGQTVALLSRNEQGTWVEVLSLDGLVGPCWVDVDLLEIPELVDVLDLDIGVIPPEPTPTPTSEPESSGGGSRPPCLLPDPNAPPSSVQYICHASCPVPNEQAYGSCTP